MTIAPHVRYRLSQLRAGVRHTLALALLLASLSLGAQTSQQPPTEPPQEATAETAEDESATDTAGLPPADAAAAEPEDPFDYEASEQISEDLSVSFPVDI